MNMQAVKLAFAEALRCERHRNLAETRYWCDQYKLLAKLAIAEAEKQEPVAWMHPDWLTYKRAPAPVVSYKENWTPLYTHPQPKREPLEGVIEVKAIGYHSLQLIFESQEAITQFKVAHGIKETP